MDSRKTIGVVLVAIGVVGLIVFASLYSMSFYSGRYWGMGPGMMGPGSTGYQYGQTAQITMDQAESMAKLYRDSLNNPDLEIKEIMEFQDNFYIIFYEKSTGVGAFEMLIWKTTPTGMMGQGMMGGGNMMVGQIMPEPGPNMMWNTKYGGMMGQMGGGMMGNMGGMMGGTQYGRTPTADMPVSEDEARRIGQQYLDQYYPGATIEESTRFYGYYTFDFGKDGKIVGMFSVNGYTGQVWYHGWHGSFISMKELMEEQGD